MSVAVPRAGFSQREGAVMTKKISRRQFLGATAGVGAAAYLAAPPGRSAADRGRRQADHSAAPPRRPALLGARRHGAARHRVEQQARPDADDGPPGRPGLPGRSERPRPARSASRGLRGGVRVPGLGRLRGLRVLPVHAERQRVGRQPTAAEIRSYLDNAGLVAQGTHQFGPTNLDVQTGNLIAADPAGSPTAPGENLFASCRPSA